MLHYYFFKYWTRGVIGLMLAFVIGYFCLLSYSFVAQRSVKQASSIDAQLSITPSARQFLPKSILQDQYRRSLQIYTQIQKLKEQDQDTSKLESLYADSVKSLTSQDAQEAAETLQQIESEIATLSESHQQAVSPEVTDVVISQSPTPSESAEPVATNAATIE